MTNEEIHRGLCDAAELIGVKGGKVYSNTLPEGEFQTTMTFGSGLPRVINYDNEGPDDCSFHMAYTSCKPCGYRDYKEALQHWMEFFAIDSNRELMLSKQKYLKFGPAYVLMGFWGEKLDVRVSVIFRTQFRRISQQYHSSHPSCIAAVRKYFLEPYQQEILIDVLEEYVDGFSEAYHKVE